MAIQSKGLREFEERLQREKRRERMRRILRRFEGRRFEVCVLPVIVVAAAAFLFWKLSQ